MHNVKEVAGVFESFGMSGRSLGEQLEFARKMYGVTLPEEDFRKFKDTSLAVEKMAEDIAAAIFIPDDGVPIPLPIMAREKSL